MQLGKYGQAESNEDRFSHSRRDDIRDDITKRLRQVCAHLSDAEFKKLVETMTEQKLKGERNRSL
jgi:hypothetical protein